MARTGKEHEASDGQALTLLAQNNRAWDALYGATEAYVWGNEPPPFLAHHLETLRPMLGPNDCVLDIAAGEGRSGDLLLETGATVIACDASLNGLKKFPRRLRGKIDRVRCDITSLPLATGTVTAALLIDVIETMPTAAAALREIYRILAPDGRLLCNIPGPDDSVASNAMHPLEEGGYLYGARYYYRFYTEAEAAGLIDESGFSIESEERCSWWERAHPMFRSQNHLHISRVFLLKKGE